MAILENRAKNRNMLVGLGLTLSEVCRRFSAVAFVLVSLQLMYFLPPENARKASLEFSGQVINPIAAIFKSCFQGIQNLGTSFHYFHDLKQENIALKLEVSRLRSVEELASALKGENIALKQSLNFVSEPNYGGIDSRLVAVAASVYGDSAIIHAGSNDGIEKEQVVINDSGIIGRVIETSDHFSRIMLITDFDSRIPVTSSHSRLQAVVAGAGERRGRLLYVPDSSALQVGEILMTSGDGKLYPAGLPVAKVSGITPDEVYVTPLADLSKVDFVKVIINNQVDNSL